MTETVTRMPPGTVADIEAHQGWALSCHPPGPARVKPVDLLLVHGMGAGGWSWPESWIGAFTGAGYRCWTLTLPGREGGATLATDPGALDRALTLALQTGDVERATDLILRALPGTAALDGPDLADFTTALQAAVAQIGRPVAIVAHSLGGAVAQNYLRRSGRAAATVLLCSVPPYGTWRAAAEMAVLNPALWVNLARFSLLGPRGADLEVMRANLFPGGIGDREYTRVLNGMTDESLTATLQALGVPPFAPLPGPRRDMLVIGGARDRLVPPLDVMLTGLYYGTVPQILPDMGHMPMHDTAGSAAIPCILGWLERRLAEEGARVA